MVGPFLGNRDNLGAWNAGRVALWDAVCRRRSVQVANLEVGSGPCFDMDMDALPAELREADQRFVLFRAMGDALEIGPREVVTEEGTWQYGICVEE